MDPFPKFVINICLQVYLFIYFSLKYISVKKVSGPGMIDKFHISQTTYQPQSCLGKFQGAIWRWRWFVMTIFLIWLNAVFTFTMRMVMTKERIYSNHDSVHDWHWCSSDSEVFCLWGNCSKCSCSEKVLQHCIDPTQCTFIMKAR